MATLDVVRSKRITVSPKRQITIPQKFFLALEFGDEAECVMRGEELIIRPVRDKDSGTFDDFILSDLVHEGYGGEELLAKFKEARGKVRAGVEQIIEDAYRAAEGKDKGASFKDVFGEDL